MTDTIRDVYPAAQADLDMLRKLTGVPIIESKLAPADAVLSAKMVGPFDPPGITGQHVLMCQDGWRQIIFPIFMADQKKLMREHLRKVVRETEIRLFGSSDV